MLSNVSSRKPYKSYADFFSLNATLSILNCSTFKIKEENLGLSSWDLFSSLRPGFSSVFRHRHSLKQVRSPIKDLCLSTFVNDDYFWSFKTLWHLMHVRKSSHLKKVTQRNKESSCFHEYNYGLEFQTRNTMSFTRLHISTAGVWVCFLHISVCKLTWKL